MIYHNHIYIIKHLKSRVYIFSWKYLNTRNRNLKPQRKNHKTSSLKTGVDHKWRELCFTPQICNFSLTHKIISSFMNHQELYSDILEYFHSLYQMSYMMYLIHNIKANSAYTYRTKESFLVTLNAFTWNAIFILASTTL